MDVLVESIERLVDLQTSIKHELSTKPINVRRIHQQISAAFTAFEQALEQWHSHPPTPKVK